MTKKTRTNNGGKHSLFNKRYWENWSVICKRIELDYFFIPCMEKNPKWIKDLNVRPDIIKIGGSFLPSALVFLIYFFRQRKRKQNKQKKWDYMNLKRCWIADEGSYLQEWKGHLLNRRNYLQMIYQIGG